MASLTYHVETSWEEQFKLHMWVDDTTSHLKMFSFLKAYNLNLSVEKAQKQFGIITLHVLTCTVLWWYYDCLNCYKCNNIRNNNQPQSNANRKYLQTDSKQTLSVCSCISLWNLENITNDDTVRPRFITKWQVCLFI